ncbi:MULTISPECIES: sugar-binding domain-containing protein [unclassified Cellulomonas]|uniref:sugar-binding transcriptional regulator n=1 Tax=unclassified Cellulomonas TaxID=2620175 RepID=UPI0019B02BE3|nr:sugar-binding domain-containing protein [Cellulomonas sp. ES6]MBD3781077.1 transcriptional regulator [Micrococcales bacterium]WHP18970.1 sugar-binding domain-containing protein [Cellulomonas sp. ES6]
MSEEADARGSSPDERGLMVLAARRYYVDDVSKVQIAQEMGLSRFKVARLLEQARAEGVVTITVHADGLRDPALAARLREHLGLAEVTVVESGGDADAVRRQVGEAAAQVLSATLRPGEVLGLAWGRTLTAMSAALPPLPRVDVVQLTGAIGTDLAESPVEIVRRVALRSGGVARPIFAPLVVDDARTAAALRRQPDVAAALQMFGSVTTAVVSVGSWDPPDSQLLRTIGEDERQALLEAGVRAEVASLLVSDDGHLVAPGFQDRCVTIAYEQMRAVPRIVAAAGGARKARAVAAIVRAGLCTELVTDRALAEALLALPPVARGLTR